MRPETKLQNVVSTLRTSSYLNAENLGTSRRRHNVLLANVFAIYIKHRIISPGMSRARISATITCCLMNEPSRY